jgi:hypothetical protein
MNHEVYLILDPHFDGDLWSLSRAAHVWIVESAENDVASRAVRARETEGYSPLHGVTTFNACEAVLPHFYDSLSVIDCHHNQSAAPRPWDTIHVVGVPRKRVRASRIAEALNVEGVALENERQGFAIRRRTRRRN